VVSPPFRSNRCSLLGETAFVGARFDSDADLHNFSPKRSAFG